MRSEEGSRHRFFVHDVDDGVVSGDGQHDDVVEVEEAEDTKTNKGIDEQYLQIKDEGNKEAE